MNATTLYGITSEYAQLLADIEENSGEITPKIEEMLQINEAQLVEKSADYAKMIKYLNGVAEQAKAEKQRIETIKKQAEKLAEKLSENIKIAMQMYGYEKIDSGLTKISLRKSTVCVIDDEDSIPNDYKVYKVEVSKSAVKDALKAGVVVEGAHLEENKSLQIK